MTLDIIGGQHKARILDVSEKEYRADPCAVPSLNQSTAHVLVSQSPLHAWTQHPRLGKLQQSVDDDGVISEDAADEDESKKDTNATIRGKVLHKILLGKGEDVRIIDAKDYKTNFAKQEKREAIAKGQIPVIAAKYEDYEIAAAAIRNAIGETEYTLAGESEVAFEWEEDGEHGPIICRCRMDNVVIANGFIIDVKTCYSANPQKVRRKFTEFGYHIQDVAYRHCIERYRPELQGRAKMIFLFAEEKPPYDVYPVEPSGMMRELGSMQWNRALFTWERCLRTGHWPGYGKSGPERKRAVPVDPMPWVMKEEVGSDGRDW